MNTVLPKQNDKESQRAVSEPARSQTYTLYKEIQNPRDNQMSEPKKKQDNRVINNWQKTWS